MMGMGSMIDEVNFVLFVCFVLQAGVFLLHLFLFFAEALDLFVL